MIWKYLLMPSLLAFLVLNYGKTREKEIVK